MLGDENMLTLVLHLKLVTPGLLWIHEFRNIRRH